MTETPTKSEQKEVQEEEQVQKIESQEQTQQQTQQQLEELTELLKRTQANFENYRKQTEKRVEELRLMAAKQVILEFLPVYDHLQLALRSMQNSELSIEKKEEHQHPNEFVEGVVLIAAQFKEILQNLGVQEIPTVGEKANPYLHEPLLTVESESVQEGFIVEVFQSGFILHGQVIRHAKVKVSAGKKK